MARVLEDLDGAAGHRLVCDLGVVRGDERVAPSPDHERRQHAGQIEPVGGAHALAARVDHGAQRVEEGLPRPGVAERRVPGGHLGDIGTDTQPQPVQRLPDGRAEAEHARVGDQGQHDLGARQRRRAEQEVHLAADAAARHEHEPLRERRVLVGELHRHAAAE